MFPDVYENPYLSYFVNNSKHIPGTDFVQITTGHVVWDNTKSGSQTFIENLLYKDNTMSLWHRIRLKELELG